MKTFAIDNGDLVLTSGTFTEVTGSRKLIQDLGLAMREAIGSDRFHLRWGSQLPDFIGDAVSTVSMQRVREEVQRIIDNFAAVQRDNLSRDAARGRKPRYGTGEVIRRVKDIAVRQDFDSVHVRVAISTMTADEVVLVATVRN